MKIETKNKRIVTTALISMTDVVFLLIIFLLVSSSFINHGGLKINLPKATTTKTDFPRTIEVVLTQDETLLLDSKPIAWESIVPVLKDRIVAQPELIISLSADENVPLKSAVKALDLLRQCGTDKVMLATQKDKVIHK